MENSQCIVHLVYKNMVDKGYIAIHVHNTCAICYSYTIALSGLFELYTRGGCLNHEAKPSGLNTHLERTIQ